MACVLLFVAIFSWGQYRLSSAKEGHTNIKVRIVQPNISQNQKWDDNLRNHIVQTYMDMSASEGHEEINHIIWPESALPFFLEEDSYLVDVMSKIVPEGGYLIAGSMHATRDKFGFSDQMWNSLHVIDDKGQIKDIYDKHHLVPFGEYVPFRSILPIDKITQGIGEFSKGEGVRTLSIDGFPAFSPLICYEAIFPDGVTDGSNRASLLINVTNDAWYGLSSGPYQHFNMVRMRAAEQGIPLIRAANTGISGVIDAYGRVIAKTGLSERAVLDEYIPQRSGQNTIYATYGIKSSLLLVIGCLLLFSIRVKKLRFIAKTR